MNEIKESQRDYTNIHTHIYAYRNLYFCACTYVCDIYIYIHKHLSAIAYQQGRTNLT